MESDFKKKIFRDLWIYSGITSYLISQYFYFLVNIIIISPSISSADLWTVPLLSEEQAQNGEKNSLILPVFLTFSTEMRVDYFYM